MLIEDFRVFGDDFQQRMFFTEIYVLPSVDLTPFEWSRICQFYRELGCLRHIERRRRDIMRRGMSLFLQKCRCTESISIAER
jgi:hypothetical protein